MKILVTGAYGQLGRSLFKYKNESIEYLWTGKSIPIGRKGMHLDILDRINLRDLIKLCSPDVLINLAALTNVDRCEKNPLLAQEINAEGVKNICDFFPGKIIQISTDYVFNGEKGPYAEDDRVAPLSVYGATKLEAERIVMSHSSKNLVLRANVLYDYDTQSKASFLNWVVNSLRRKKPIKVVNDQINNPTWTQSMAKIIFSCIESNLNGIYHWGDAEFLSRYEFALKIARSYKLDTNLISPILSKELDQIAPRPLNSGLKSHKLLKVLDIYQPSINECLKKIILDK
tara:strand:+ start:32 stop:892 length:861 start_codon:yes stop_codon:yes gene_type:complete